MASTKLVLFALLLIFVAGGNIDGAQGSRVSTPAVINFRCTPACLPPYCRCDFGNCDCTSAPLDPAARMLNQQH
ncbi:hypothetical protein LINGRAHAP2_LOCUS33857 [Linum grandiflorum]